MTTISGTWRVNANGSQGLLTLTSNDNVSFSGSMALDDTGDRMDAVQGVWNDAERMISFTRSLPDGTVQTYTGFLGDNHPENLILAGSLSGVAGWVAAPLQPAVTYILSLDKFHVYQTRDFFSFPQATDTDYVAFAAQMLTQVGYGEVLTLNSPAGKVHGGEDHLPNPDPSQKLQFAIRLQPNEGLTFTYLIMNSGFDGSDAQKVQQFLDEISNATKDALNIIYPAEKSIWEVLNDLTQYINSIQAGGCDGIVAGDKITKTAAELNQLMPAGGNTYSETREYTYTSQPQCSNPHYSVTWTFTRQ